MKLYQYTAIDEYTRIRLHTDMRAKHYSSVDFVKAGEMNITNMREE